MAKAKSRLSRTQNASGKAVVKPRAKKESPAPRKHRRREVKLAFEALSIEGGLLSPEWLALAAQLQTTHQAPTDYRIPKGLNLRDEIGRYWRIAQAHHAELVAGMASNAEPRALAIRFALGLLGDCFGFTSLAPVTPVVIGDRTYPIGHVALGGRVPVVIAPAGSGLDSPSQSLGDDNRRRSGFGLTQEYLNAADSALWGIATDGATLRLVRDNVSLTRPAWVEADLGRIFAEERYADFAALWLIIHESRFGRAEQPATESALEAWRTSGLEKGTRAREYLRTGVEGAVMALGQGFLAHVDNAPLRAAFESGTLTKETYFQELLRLVYRLIFLLTVEERELLHPPGCDQGAKGLYASGYGAKRLRERSVRRSSHDRYADLWEALKIVFRGLATGESRLALPALAGLFANEQCHWLDSAQLENRALLVAVFRLSWLREDGGLARVNWRDMGPEELGSVYESLLELVPQVSQDRRTFGFATGDQSKGNARKTSGSYYTPDGLVQVLLDSALEPVVADTIARNPDRPVEALLRLSIVDPACGSGHFLLAAARRLAGHLARLTASGTPTAHEYRQSLRQVVGRCIYGVDINPMAVELCKVALWMEAVEPGRPLTFLDAHVRCGNSLVGATPALMADGIPDAAFDPIEGDDRKVAAGLKKRNKAARGGQQGFETAFSRAAEGGTIGLVHAVQAVDAAPDENLGAVEQKQRAWQALLDSEVYLGKQLLADAWCAAFVWQKSTGPASDIAPTHDVWQAIQADPRTASPALIAEVRRLAHAYRFFHWHLAFPQVFAKGGFDVVLGNPPWERVKIQEEEWFAERAPEIAEARNAAARKIQIEQLKSSQPDLSIRFQAEQRAASAEAALLTRSGRFPLCGRGDVNTYSVFAECASALLSRSGAAGMVLPPGILTDDTNKAFARDVVDSRRLRAFLAFTNRGYTFPQVESTMAFSLLVVGCVGDGRFRVAGQLWSVNELREPHRTYELTVEDVALFNPNTRSLPVFRESRDMRIVREVYERFPVIENEAERSNPWALELGTMFHMANASSHFKSRGDLERDGWVLWGNRFTRDRAVYIPLYESKLCHQYNHRHATFGELAEGDALFKRRAKTGKPRERELEDPAWLPIPRYWLPLSVVEGERENVREEGWILAYRRTINAVADARSVVASILPLAGAGDSLFLISGLSAKDACVVNAALNSFVFDYIARQKATGGNLSFYVLKQLPLPAPSMIDDATRDFIVRRVLELTVTSFDLIPFGKRCGYDGAPFRWVKNRRAILRAELDAAFLRIYGIQREDVEYVLDFFDVVRRRDESESGQYHTKQLILEIFDAMSAAAGAKREYQTRLEPPPAHPLMAHHDTSAVLELPSTMPTLPPGEDVARWIWAVLHHHNGAVTRLDLARAFALRSQPKTLVALATDELGKAARAWAKKVGGRSVQPGALGQLLKDLEARGALRFDIDQGRSVVCAGDATPSVDAIDPWSRFEARLAIGVLAALEPADLASVDVGLSKEDLAPRAMGRQ